MNNNNELLNLANRIPEMTKSTKKLFSLLEQTNIQEADVISVLEANPAALEYVYKIDSALRPDHRGDECSLSFLIKTYSANECIEWALTGAFKPIFAPESDPMALNDLFLHSLSTALCAVLLAKECNLYPQSNLFLSGLLHDVGLAVLVQYLGVDFGETVELALDESIAIDEAERKRLGCDHGDVGAESIAKWSENHLIADVVKYHHRPDHHEGPHQTQIDLVHIADMLSRMVGIGIGNEGLAFRTSVESEKRIGFTPKIEENVIFKLLAGMEILQGKA
jgi:hypothetical protein